MYLFALQHTAIHYTYIRFSLGFALFANMASYDKCMEIIFKKANKNRLEQSNGDAKVGFFGDAGLLESEDKLQIGIATHVDIIVALIEEGEAADLARTFISKAVLHLDKENGCKLYASGCGSREEWLRAEGNALKKMLGFIRLTEYRSIDFSRQSTMLKMVCGKWRDHARPISSLKRRSKSPLSTPQTAAKKIKAGNGNQAAVSEPRKAIWELTQHDINKMFGGGAEKVAAEIESSPEMLSSDSEETDKDSKKEQELVRSDLASSSSTSQGCRYYHDYGKMCMCRVFASGKVEDGEPIEDSMEEFTWYRFSDGIEMQSEWAPALQFTVQRPKNVMKKPAAKQKAGAQKKACADQEKGEEVKKEKKVDEKSVVEAVDEDVNCAHEDEGEEEEVESQPDTEVLTDNGSEAGSMSADPPGMMEELPKVFDFGSGSCKIKMVYATKQTYAHACYTDGSKLFLCAISASMNENHKSIMSLVMKEVFEKKETYDYMNGEEMKAVALRIRGERMGLQA